VEKALALALENAVFKLPPIDDIFNESWAEYLNVVQDFIKKADRNTEFEIVHALMVHFFNRKPVGEALESPSSAISMNAARNIERRMRETLGTAPSHKTIFDNFKVMPKSAERIARRLQRRQLMLAFFAQSCGAVDRAGKSPISQRELDWAKRALDEWGIELTVEAIASHLARAHEALIHETKNKATRADSEIRS
jgi:hypothetical protein